MELRVSKLKISLYNCRISCGECGRFNFRFCACRSQTGRYENSKGGKEQRTRHFRYNFNWTKSDFEIENLITISRTTFHFWLYGSENIFALSEMTTSTRLKLVTSGCASHVLPPDDFFPVDKREWIAVCGIIGAFCFFQFFFSLSLVRVSWSCFDLQLICATRDSLFSCRANFMEIFHTMPSTKRL